MRQVIIQAGTVSIGARLRDTPTAEAIWKALPIKADAQTWGDEVYFDVPVSANEEPDATDVVEPGQIAFWPSGKAIAIGYGPTPISQSGECRLVSACNIWADATDDVKQLKSVRAGESISVEKA